MSIKEKISLPFHIKIYGDLHSLEGNLSSIGSIMSPEERIGDWKITSSLIDYVSVLLKIDFFTA